MVTFEEAEKYLLKLERDRSKIDNIKTELQILRKTGWNTSADLSASGVQSSGNSDPVWNTYAYIQKLEKEIEELEQQYILDVQERKELINKVEKTLHYDILYGRYILFESLSEIAQRKKYCYEWVRKSRKKAIEEVQKLLNS